jgi:hypothetical protein
MAYIGYKAKIESLSPVAVKLCQTEVHAPGHDTWGVVTCDACGEKFCIGPNRIYGSRRGEHKCVEQFEAMLAEEHRKGQAHSNSYELAD